MTAKTYEIVEKDEGAQYGILGGLARSPVQGVAYLFMMAGDPVSAADITDFLTLSDERHIRQFNEAVVELEVNGLIKKAEDSSWTDTTCSTCLADTDEQGVAAWPIPSS
ncbi:MAG: hypothetical protein V3R87_09240 [Dehalococcoidia bacterium]